MRTQILSRIYLRVCVTTIQTLINLCITEILGKKKKKEIEDAKPRVQ